MTSIFWGLFSASFLASTLLPGGSEVLLVYLVGEYPIDMSRLWLVATLGNTLGGFFSWGMGFAIQRNTSKITTILDKHPKLHQWIQQYGAASLLFSWLPILGDPLCLIAGYLKTHWLSSVIYLFIGKGLRYFILLWAVTYL